MKKSNLILLGVLGFILLFISAAAIYIGNTVDIFNNEDWISQNTVSEEISLEDFNSITAAGHFHIDFKQDSIYKIVIKADSALMTKIGYTVLNGELHFEVEEKGRYPEINLAISSPTLEKLHIAAGSSFKTNYLKENTFSANVSAGSHMEIVADFNEFSIDLSAGSILDARGTANLFNIEGSAGVKINAGELVVQKCNIDISAGASADINVVEELGVSASSGALITYAGSPIITRMDMSAGASLKKR